MKTSYSTSIYIISIICFVSVYKINAQTFERIETYNGLGSIRENNGAALADYDADGDLDVFVVAKAQDVVGDETTQSKLFRNNNDGTFTNVTQNSGLTDLFPEGETGETSIAFTGFKFGAFWGDYDNDGYPDLFMTHTNKMQLLHNEGNGTFKEVTVEAGFKKYNDCINTGATWFDYNKDGFLDIFIADWDSDCEGNRLYKNNQDGTFSDVSHIFQGVNSKHSYQSIPFDFNGDGWLDLYVANDFNPGPNDLFINNNGTGFTEQAANYGLNTSRGDMGVTIGDYNNDGEFDIYVTTIGDNALMKKTVDGSYEDLARTFKIYNAGWAWDVSFSDFDLDRDEDLFVVNGFDYPNSGDWHNVYFENTLETGVEGFVNSSEKTKLNEEAISVTEAVFDYDNDGDLDIFVTNNDGPSYFYENKLTDVNQPAEDLHWFKVKLEGTTSNRDAIGATLSVKTARGLLHRYYSGKGFLSQHLKPVHFGLGSDTEILELKITWPSGLVETHTNIPADKTILAKEGNGYQILDVQPSIKPYGCMDPNSCNYNPDATVNTWSCNYLE
ncbi:CRTAC1 family protein, partial [Aestuariibaculum sp. M13]|uniref:CRTAC1 family protein n=1 Tax=Aestuariibaculum sp. M13 TaxID=2967132 RepID=UPI002159D006